MTRGVLAKLGATTGLGFGGAPLGNLYSALDEDTARATVDEAWRQGVRYFDTAPLYGQGLSESRLGRALAGRPRDSFHVSSKVGRLLTPLDDSPREQAGYVSGLPFAARFDYSEDGALRSIEASLQRLGLSRLDIVYIHDVDRMTHGAEQPRRFQEAMDGAYRALDRLRTEGAVGAIGLGVNEWEPCDAALSCGDFDCFMLAGRYTLLDASAARTLVPRCVERGVKLVLGGVYNSGILATGAVAGARYDYQPAAADVLDKVRRLEAACAAHRVPLRAAALQFALACPAAAAIVVGARSPGEMDDNASMARWKVPSTLWDDLRLQGLLPEALMLDGA